VQFSDHSPANFSKYWLFGMSLLLLGAPTLYGQDIWQGPSGSWFTNSDWSLGVPPTVDLNAIINNGTTVQIGPGPDGVQAFANSLTIGETTAGSVLQMLPGGVLHLSTPLIIGTGGTVLFSGGTIFVNSIVDNGAIIFDVPENEFLSGTVSGTGKLVMNIVGTLFVSGTQTYSGPTILTSGTFQAETPTALSPNSAFTVNSTLDLNGFNNAIASLSGTGDVINSSSTSAVLTVGSSTSSLSSGSLLVVNNGIISPGNPTGTLTISGNYVQTSTGTLRIGVGGTAPGQFGLLAVSGHATLGGTLQIGPVNGFQLEVGNKLTFLTATGGVSGNFSAIQSLFPNSSAVEAQFVVLPGAVEIEGTQGSFVSILQSLGPVVTPNELAVAKALDSAIGDPREAALFAFLDSQPTANLPHDLSLIAPTQISAINASVSIGKVQISNIGQRMANIHAGSTGFSSSGFTLNGEGPTFGDGLAGETGAEGKSGPSVLAPIPENRWGFFVTGLGEFTNVDSTPNANGYNVDTGGITLGVDYRVTSNFAVGLLGGYAHNNVSLVGGGNIDVNGGTFGAYATLFGDGFYLDTAVTGGPNGYDTHRTALQGSANGSTEGADINVVVSAGYDWKHGNFSIGPTASFQFGYVGLNGFSETGSLAPLRFPDQNTESETTAFGARAMYEWKIGKITLIPQVSAAWQHEYGSVAYQVVAGFASGAGTNFTVNGPEIGRDSLLIGAGVSMIWSDRFSTYVFYDGDVARTNYDSHTVTGGFRITF
jgi:autotransporter-associated beta strand protein